MDVNASNVVPAIDETTVDGNRSYAEENIDDIVAGDTDLTFQQSRLVVTDLQRTPRVRSYPDLVDINLLFSDENFYESADAFTNDSISNDSEGNTNNDNSSGTDSIKDNNSDIDGDSQSFDCFKFVLLLRALNTQKNKGGIHCVDDASKNTNKTEKKKDDTTQTTKKLNFTDVARIQKNINNWTKKVKKLHMANVNPEDWGIELTDMAGGDSSSAEETCTNFDRLKTMDVWQQISHYLKLKMKTTSIEVTS